MPAERLKYYKVLDGLRGLAALMVFYNHFPVGNNIQVLHKIALFGQSGVTLFFVLSGFLITRILLLAKDTDHYYRNFYMRRLLRIFPLYYLGVLIYCIISPALRHLPVPDFAQQSWYWFYLQNIAMSFGWPMSYGPHHFWSLAVEEHFYLLWPVAVSLTPTKHLYKVSIALVVAAIVFRACFTSNIAALNFFTFCCTDALALGGMLAVMELKGLHIQYLRVKNYILSFTIPALIIVWCFSYDNPTSNNLRPLLLSTFYFSLIWYIITAKEHSLIVKALQIRVLVYTGLISYGIYIYHPLCNIIINEQFMLLPSALKFLSSLCLTYIVSTASYFLYERYFTRLKRNFI
jgi:peptidoglycan/LPS O-acetylase OafA/YrhL